MTERIIIQTHLRGGGGVRAYLRGGLFNLAKTMVSVLHKELKYKVEKIKDKKLEVMQLGIKNNLSRLL